MKILAIDVGGANIKVADGHGYTRCLPFALWRFPEQLAERLAAVIDAAPMSTHIAATMTGELADCYATKREGVEAIVDALIAAGAGREVGVYLTDGSIASAAEAKRRYRIAAASNWHALASFASRLAPQGDALLIDIGSTTIDVIPLVQGVVATDAESDLQRLLRGQLVYAGVERTPICSVLDSAPYRGRTCPLARELFATMLDAYLVLGEIGEDASRDDTADGRPATIPCAVRRLSRCLCADEDEFQAPDAVSLAERAAAALSELLWNALEQVRSSSGLNRECPVILSGHGDFVFSGMARSRRYAPAAVTRLSDEIGANAARCAPAFALATIAGETWRID